MIYLIQLWLTNATIVYILIAHGQSNPFYSFSFFFAWLKTGNQYWKAGKQINIHSQSFILFIQFDVLSMKLLSKVLNFWNIWVKLKKEFLRLCLCQSQLLPHGITHERIKLYLYSGQSMQHDGHARVVSWSCSLENIFDASKDWNGQFSKWKKYKCLLNLQ